MTLRLGTTSFVRFVYLFASLRLVVRGLLGTASWSKRLN